MNAAVLENTLATQVEKALDNVVELPRSRRPDEETPVSETELERHAGVHRHNLAAFEQRRADARRDGKAALAALKLERTTLREKFDADLAVLGKREAAAKAATEEAVATSIRLAAASRAALREIEKDG